MSEEKKPRRSTRARADDDKKLPDKKSEPTAQSGGSRGNVNKDSSQAPPQSDVKSPDTGKTSDRKSGDGLSDKGSGAAKKPPANTGGDTKGKTGKNTDAKAKPAASGEKNKSTADSGAKPNEKKNEKNNGSDKGSAEKAGKAGDKPDKSDKKGNKSDNADKKGVAAAAAGGGADKASASGDDKSGADKNAEKSDTDKRDKSGDTAGDKKGDNDGGGKDDALANKDSSVAAKMANDESKASASGANATGVDYSDKGLKDRLEHQAADIAMDATPGLGQANSARKVLKNVNKAKKDATGNQDSNDIADKLEKGTDKAVEGGIKGAKVAAGTAAGGVAGAGIGAGIMAMKMLAMLKGFITGAISKTLGMLAGAWQAATGFVSGVLGIGATGANIVGMGIAAVIVTTATGLGIGATGTMSLKDPGMACLPETKTVPPTSQEYVEGGGDAALLQEEAAKKLWSVYSELGGTKEQTSAVLGNLHHESQGLDPTATETIYDEKYGMGPKKMAALAADYKVDLIDAAYGQRFPAIDYIGIGLAQWTNERNRLLIAYAEAQGVNWYDFDTQVRFMLAGDQEYRQEQLTEFLSGSEAAIDVETKRFMNTWIGLSGNHASLGERQSAALNYNFILEMAEADTNYAETILSGLNVNRSEGNAAAGSFYKDDGCGEFIASHYRGKEVDGTGEVPAGLALVPWTRESLPDGLKPFAVDPSLAGLSWGTSSGWANGIISDQCVALATSYFMKLYPDWDKGGRGVTRPFGNGKDTAPGWASHYGSLVTDVPQAGAVFSDKTTSIYGHTGIVQHVFANGDILIVEQNVRGASGAGNNMSYSWSWRVITKDKYQQNNYVFFKPADAEPQWSGATPVDGA